MKTKLITDIQNRMKEHLDDKQQNLLFKTLLDCFDNVKQIELKKFDDDNYVNHNSKLLNLFLAAKEVEGCSKKTVNYYKSTIQLMLKKVDMDVLDVSTDHIREYLSNHRKERNSSKVTLDNIRRIFSSFFSWLEDEDYIIKNPVKRIHKVKQGRVIKDTLTDEDLEKIRDVCDEKRDLAMVELLISTGVRVGELVNLNINDIDFYERECVVFGKGESERIVYFDARTKIHLLDYIKSRDDDNPALFVTLNNPHQRLGITGVETRIRELGVKSNINKRVHPHKFRRTLATMAIDKGMSIEHVQKLLGHVQIDTTMGYAMVNQNNVKNSHRKFIS
ncbi:MAG: tyrosine-type recombinase/integrase [Methanosphaera sp.]|nr:tyrosine-type recombinase/integrase [Methanosphaera sp.]